MAQTSKDAGNINLLSWTELKSRIGKWEHEDMWIGLEGMWSGNTFTNPMVKPSLTRTHDGISRL